ncbi:MAG: hypothetical protein CMJ39_05735 [Phycisphaerae bacterium]|nr:hypothetical protein [Phycisphaerae bacterium]
MTKKYTRNVMTTLALAAATSLAATAHARDGAQVEVIQDDATGTVLQYEFAAPTLKQVRVGNEAAVIVQLGDESINAAAGDPAIADVRRSITIGPDAKVAATFIGGDFVEMHDIDVASSRGPILRSIDPATVPYTFGEAYEQDAFWPNETVELGDPYIIRNQRGVIVDVNPIQYNPVTKTLRVYRNMTVKVEPVGIDNGNVLDPAKKKVDGSAFHGIYENHFLNYSRDLRYDPIESEGELLVICHDPWMSNMQPFVDHKNGIGINTMMVSISSVGNNSGSIMNYITDMYGSNDLVYVLLVGDIAQIASPTVPLENGRSDPSYALMTGDSYPDLIVGRFSAESAADVDTQVERVLTFENENWTQDPYYRRALGIGSAEGSGIGDDGESDPVHLGYILDDLEAYDYTYTQLIVDPSGTVQQGVDALNEGIGAIAYCGHGTTDCFYNGSQICINEINNLTNTHMMPWIISVACMNGQFDAGTCFAEAWLRATDGGLPSGAMGIYASSVNQYWAEPMSAEDEVFDLYVAEDYVTFGALCYAGSCLMMDEYGSSGVDMYETWHIFGDPTLRVVGTTAPPEGMNVTGSGFSAEGPNGGPFSPDTAELTVKNYDAESLDFNAVDDVPWLEVVNGSGTLGQDEEAVITVQLNSDYAASMGNGFYQGSVTITGSNGDVSVKEFDLEIGVPVAIYNFDLDDNPGWSMAGQWAFGQPTGNGGNSYGNPDPTSGATGSNVFGVNLNGDYSNAQGSWSLTSNAIDCSQLTDTSLKFQRWLNTDYQPYVSASVEISTNGSSWQTLWENGGSEITDSNWSLQEYDISSIADQQETVYVRWGYAVTSGAWVYSGWNIDDVAIWGIAPEDGPECPTDLDGNGTTDVNDILLLIAAWETPDGDVNGDGTTDVNDILDMLGAFGNPC